MSSRPLPQSNPKSQNRSTPSAEFRSGIMGFLPRPSFAQASLAITLFATIIGTYKAVVPPHANNTAAPPPLETGDFLLRSRLASQHGTKILLAPLAFLALHTFLLILYYPTIPKFLLRHNYGEVNKLNPRLITWSPATVIPLAIALFIGIPLRLVPYAELGKNFTFALAQPDRLVTTGIYKFIQHPSYTGVVTLQVSLAVLLCRMDGVLSCWVSSRRWYNTSWRAELMAFPIMLGGLLFVLSKRVEEEEAMLRGEFGKEWERWHAATARFIPWVW